MKDCLRVLFALLLVVSSLGLVHAQTIGGTVTDDSTGLPLRETLVRFFNPHGLWVQGTHTDSTGSYHAHLDTGKYLVRFEKFGYVAEWFDNAHELAGALVMDLHADTTLVADAGLRPVERPQVVTVTGTVTDSVSGLPLPNTFVVFLRPHRDLRLLQFLSELFGGPVQERWTIPGFGWLHGVVWAGLTDANGNYEAHLLAGAPHIALSFKPGYVPEFFNNKISPFDADRLVFNGNTGGVNFDLVQNPLAVNSLSGTVVDSAGTGVPSHVLLVRLLPHSALIVRYDATDSLGQYHFQHLAPGRFLVKAVPVDGFAPAWHANSECGVRNWHNADVVDLSSDVSGVDVCVRSSHSNGFGRIAGLIQPGGGGIGVSSLSSEGGVTVYAISDATNEVAGYDVTENDGSYAIENLVPGSYTILVDKEGFVSNNTPSVTLVEGNGFESSATNLPIQADPVLNVSDTPNGVPTAFSLHQNYPNPFNPTTTIRFDIPIASNVSVKVYNLIGQKVIELTDGVRQPGAYAINWDGRSEDGATLTSGIYFVKLVAVPLDRDKPEYDALRKMIMIK